MSSYIKIPEEVERSEFLCPMAKLLYGRIAALAQKEGYCWATNQHFAEWYNCSQSQVSRWLAELQKAGFIECEIVAKNNTRKICVVSAKTRPPLRKNAETPTQKCGDPYAKTLIPLRKNAETPTQKAHTNRNIIKEYNNKNIIKEKEEEAAEVFSLSSLFSSFESAITKFTLAGIIKNEPAKTKTNFSKLYKIALNRVDLPAIALNSKIQQSVSKEQNEAIQGEINAFLASFEHFAKIKAKQGDSYIPRLLEKILSSEEYNLPLAGQSSGGAAASKPFELLLSTGLIQSELDALTSSSIFNFEQAKAIFIAAANSGRVEKTAANLDLFKACLKQLRPTLS